MDDEQVVEVVEEKPSTPVKVKIIRNKNGMMLIEWEDGQLRRCWITEELAQKVVGEHAWVVNPERGMPFGDDFTSIIPQVSVTPQMFDAEFKRRGIWTFEDIINRQNEVMAAIQTVIRVNLGTVYEAASQAVKNRRQ